MTSKQHIKDLPEDECYFFTLAVGDKLAKKWPKWKLTYAIDKNGTVYAPCGLVGYEPAITMYAHQDGEYIFSYGGHNYISTEWIGNNYTSWTENMKGIDAAAKHIYAF